MKRWAIGIMLALAFCLAVCSALAESAASLPECASPEEVMDWLLLPASEGEKYIPRGVQGGSVRYLSQNQQKDPAFCPEYWIGDWPGGPLDLTLEKSADGKAYDDHCGVMCTRAVYSMALSYLGVDCSPGGMSRMMGQRSLDAPYDCVTAELSGLERVTFDTHVFDTMLEHYLADKTYSPIYVYLKRPNGGFHALLVVGRNEAGQCLVVDPSIHWVKEKPVYAYYVRFSTSAHSIISATFNKEWAGSKVQGFCQWRLRGAEEP